MQSLSSINNPRQEMDSVLSKSRFGERVALTLIVLLSAFGSYIHVFSPTLSFLNLFAFSLTPFLIMKLMKGVVAARGVWYFSSLVFLLCLNIVVAISESSQMATRELRNVVATVFFSSIAIYCLTISPMFAFKLARAAFFAISAVAVLQVSHEILGVGLEPRLGEQFRQYGQEGFQIGFPAVFGNPNDFSAFVSCYFLLFLIFKRVDLLRGRLFFGEILFIAMMLFISGSRISIVLFILGLLFFSKAAVFIIAGSSAVAVLTLGGAWSQADYITTEVYTLNRFAVEFELIMLGHVGDSIGVRAGSHIYFLSNPIEFVVGSFSYEPACPQFFYFGGDSLLAYNPHSFFIGLFCVFGALALPFVLMLSRSILPSWKGFLRQPLFCLYLYSALIGLTSVSSWFLAHVQCVFFLVLAFSVWLRRVSA